jgi:hypothetical protein
MTSTGHHHAPAWFDISSTQVMEPEETAVGWIAAFADPDGNPVGLLSP